MKREVIEILIKQMEDTLATLKALLAEEGVHAAPVAPEPKKKPKLKAVSREELIKKFGTHTLSAQEQEEQKEEVSEEPVADEKKEETAEIKESVVEETVTEPEPVKTIEEKKPKLVHKEPVKIDSIDLKNVDVKPVLTVKQSNIGIRVTDEPDTEEDLGREILQHLKIDEPGASVLRLQKRYFDNNCEKLFIDKWHVNVTLLNNDMRVIKTQTVTWKSLTKFHYLLKRRGIDRHTVSADPHKNWMPRVINLDLG
jgi:hypothetical protein